MPYHRTVHETEILLGTRATDVAGVVGEVLDHLGSHGKLERGERAAIEGALALRGAAALPSDLGHGVAVLRLRYGSVGSAHTALLRPREELSASDGAPVRFLWVVLGTGGPDEPADEALSPFGWMLADDRFTARALGAETGEQLVEVYEGYLEYIETPQLERELPEELRRTGTPLAGLLADARRRYPRYASDLVDGLHPKAIASVLFIFFACTAPAVAFGGLLSVLTEGEIGVVEAIVASAVCGTLYALLSAQPLTIIGTAGPVVIFTGLLYELCRGYGVPFLPSTFWVGAWTGLLLALMAVFEASALGRYFTRFTNEIFAALIGIIYLVEAGSDIVRVFSDADVPHDSALLSLLLALGTFSIATQLSRLRRSPYLRRPIREFLADFGPTIAIVAMTAVALLLHPVALDTLDVPAHLTTSTGRPWLVDPFEAPAWVWAAAALPALLLTTLLALNQNITTGLVNDSRHRLKKGAGYHLDLLLLGALTAGASLFGLPWVVGAVVRSLNHVRSLARTETHGGAEIVVGVRENRVTGAAVHLAMGASLFFLDSLAQLPMSVLFGLFLFMGFSSMRGNQLFERLRLWAMDPEMYPPTHYQKRVPSPVIHVYTAVQAACLGLLWLVKASPLGIVFPLFIALLVPVRFLLDRFFDRKHLAFLDAEEAPDEEEEREIV